MLALVGFVALLSLISPMSPISPEAAAANEAEADGPPGEIDFVAKNLFSTARGTFHEWRIVASQVDPQDLSRAWAEVEVDLSSIDTGIDRRDDHLRQPDFFDVETHPTARVRVDGARPDGTDDEGRRRFAVRYAVDLHGVKKTLEGDVVVVSESPLELEGHVLIDRTDFGVGPPPSRWNPMAVRAEVPVRFSVRP